MAFEAATRSAIRVLFDARVLAPLPLGRRVLIFGAGKAGITVLTELRAQPELGLHVAGFLDDDPAKRNLRIHGEQVFGARADIERITERLNIDEILIALPNATGNDITEILEHCHAAQVAAKRLPALSELIDDKVLAGQIRDVRIEDLLGRAPARLDDTRVRERLAGQVVLITGAGGSIGSELCRQIAQQGPAAIVGLDHAETALYDIEQEMCEQFPAVHFFPEIGSVQNRHRLDAVFALYRPTCVYHAAAYKHVPMMEVHPFEAIKNNVFGTRNLVRAAATTGVRDFVSISTDKAVRPTNIMGATKRIAELVCLMAPLKTVVVRFGNVLGSNGSVIPRFRKQIAGGGPVTVTHPEMRRFFMTIPEAAQLVLQAGAMGQGGEIFVLEMGQPVRIADLARKMILLSGLRPGTDIDITFTGPRPGEKLYEELSAYEENTASTPHPQIRVFTGPAPQRAPFQRTLRQLRSAVRAQDTSQLVLTLKDLVPDYNPSTSVLQKAFKAKAHST